MIGVQNVKAQASYNHSWTSGVEITEGNDFFLYNVGAKRFLDYGMNWGTRAVVDNAGKSLTVEKISNGVYALKTGISGGNGPYVGENGYMNGSTKANGGWTFTSVSVAGYTNVYTISKGDNKYLVYQIDGEGDKPACNVVGRSNTNNDYWLVISKSQRQAEKDYTFLLQNTCFNRPWENSMWYYNNENTHLGDQPHAWEANYSGTKSGGLVSNRCAEVFHSEFDVYQTATVPNGKYILYNQGFYRKDGGEAAATISANKDNAALSLLNAKGEGTAESMDGASASFSSGYYANSVTTLVTGGTLKYGVKNSNASNWVIFGNFYLEYYGNKVSVYDPTPFTNNTSATGGTWYSYPVASTEGYKISSSAATTLYYTQNENDDADATRRVNISAGGYTYLNLSEGTLYFKSSNTSTIKIESAASVLKDGDVVTGFIKDAAVTGTADWTNGRKNTGEQYTGAPDNTYMDTWNDNRNQYQSTTLPSGYYLLKAATRAIATVSVGNIYVYDGTNYLGSANIHHEGNAGNLLDKGWGWTRAPFHVDETKDVRIGFYSECGSGKWAGADDFQLYYYTTELAMKQAQVAEVVSDANAWAEKLTTTPSLEAQLSASAPSCTTIDECNTAIDNLTTAIAYARVTSPVYPEFVRIKTGANSIKDVEHTEITPGCYSTFTSAISAQTTAAENATTAEEITTATSTLKAAIKAYINSAKPQKEGEYFDITCLIENPTFENNNAEGWSGTTPNAITYGCAEFFNMNFDFYQNITGLANGSYQLSVQAFCRPGDNGNNTAGAYYDYKQRINNITAELYVNSDASTIGNIYSYTSNTTGAKVTGNDFNCTIGGDNYWVPNNMQGASLYFADGAYNTTVAALVEDGNLKIGFREENKKTNQWVIFDNFRLYYYGSSKLVYYKQYLPQLKAEVTADLSNLAYQSAFVSSENEALEDALAEDPASETEEAYKAVIDDIKDAQTAFRAAVVTYDAIVAAKSSSLTKKTANIGTGVFQYDETTNNSLFSEYETAKSAVDGYTFTTSSTAAGAQALVDALNTAISNYQNQALNAPVAEKRYWISIVEDGKDWNGNAITFIKDGRSGEGDYAIKYLTTSNANFCQAIKLTATTGNKYKMSVVRADDGKEQYLTTNNFGGYGSNKEQIRTINDASKALEVEIKATSNNGEFQLYNTDANAIIANNNNNDMYTAGSANFTIAEASQATPNLTIAAGVNWATFMSPFAISLSALNGVEAYNVSGDNDGIIEMSAVEGGIIPANKPVLLYRQTTGENYKPELSGWGTAAANNYTNGYLTGSYSIEYIPVGSYALQKQNSIVAFYKVNTENAIKVGAYRAYLTKSASSARAVLYFPEEPTAINTLEAVEAEAGALKDGKYLIDGKIVIVKNGVKYGTNGQKLN